MAKTAARNPRALKAVLVDDEGLNIREAKFVDGYVEHGIGDRAAIDAGYTENSARTFAYRLLRKAHIKAAISKRQAKLAKRADVSAERIVQEWATIGFANILDFITIDDFGIARVDLAKVSRESAAAISELTTGLDKIGRPYTKIKFHAKDPALEKLAKKLGLLKDVVTNQVLFGFAGQTGLHEIPDNELELLVVSRLHGKR